MRVEALKKITGLPVPFAPMAARATFPAKRAVRQSFKRLAEAVWNLRTTLEKSDVCFKATYGETTRRSFLREASSLS